MKPFFAMIVACLAATGLQAQQSCTQNGCSSSPETNAYLAVLPISVSNVESLNSREADLRPVLAKNGLLFSSARLSKNKPEFFYAKKSECYKDYNEPTTLFSIQKFSCDLNFTDIDPFATGANAGVPLGDDSISVAEPFISADGETLYFAADLPGGYGGSDIYYSPRTGKGWGAPVNLGPAINTRGNEKSPMLIGGDLYFSSDGYPGYGGYDLCVSALVNGQYGQAGVLKAPVNSPHNESGITLAPDQRYGYFSSDRPGGLGKDDIYFFDLDRDNIDKDVKMSSYVVDMKKEFNTMRNEGTVLSAFPDKLNDH